MPRWYDRGKTCTAPSCRCGTPCDDYFRSACVDCEERTEDVDADGRCLQCAEAHAEAEQEFAGFDDDLVERLLEAGYQWEGDCFGKTVSHVVRTARRDHADGRISKGDRYREFVSRTVNADGESRISRMKVLLLRSA